MLSVAGADRVSASTSTPARSGLLRIPFDHLTAAPVMIDYLRKHLSDDLVVVAPDAGRVKVAERFSQHLTADLAVVHKRRLRGVANQVQALHVVGDVEGRQCVLIDDMIDTAGTIVAAADLLADRGATEVWCMATHAVLSDPAIDRLKNSALTKVVVTNTLPIRRTGASTSSSPVGGEAHQQRHRRRVRGLLRVRDLRRRRTWRSPGS